MMVMWSCGGIQPEGGGGGEGGLQAPSETQRGRKKMNKMMGNKKKMKWLHAAESSHPGSGILWFPYVPLYYSLSARPISGHTAVHIWEISRNRWRQEVIWLPFTSPLLFLLLLLHQVTLRLRCSERVGVSNVTHCSVLTAMNSVRNLGFSMIALGSH